MIRTTTTETTTEEEEEMTMEAGMTEEEGTRRIVHSGSRAAAARGKVASGGGGSELLDPLYTSRYQFLDLQYLMLCAMRWSKPCNSYFSRPARLYRPNHEPQMG